MAPLKAYTFGGGDYVHYVMHKIVIGLLVEGKRSKERVLLIRSYINSRISSEM